MDAIELAEQVVGEYVLNHYRDASRRGTVCGCFACRLDSEDWSAWYTGDGDAVEPRLAAETLDHG